MRLYEIFKRRPVDQSLPYDDDYDKWKRPSKFEPWRGPHEKRYLTLMLAGIKPAVWLDDRDMPSFKPYIDDGTFILHDFDYGKRFPNEESWIATLPGQEWRAGKLQKIYSQYLQYEAAGKEKLWHARVGILLGYTNNDIRKFLNTY